MGEAAALGVVPDIEMSPCESNRGLSLVGGGRIGSRFGKGDAGGGVGDGGGESFIMLEHTNCHSS